MKNLFKIAYIALLMSFFSSVNAWIVPWTIKLWSKVTPYFSCNEERISLKNSAFCQEIKRNAYCKEENSQWECISYETLPKFWYKDYISYTNNIKTAKFSDFELPYNHIILPDDNQESCQSTALWTAYSKPTGLIKTTCDRQNDFYYTWDWESWACSWYAWKDNIITSYDQFWNVQRAEKEWVSAWYCSVSWRYARLDVEWPSISYNLPNFSWDETKWCNLNKYKSEDYGEGGNPVFSWCEHHNSSWENGWDLVWEISFTVWDLSWISKVKVELWVCEGIYDDFDTNLQDILKNTSTPSWIKDKYLDVLTFYWDKDSTKYWPNEKVFPSIKDLFWVSRFDDCLWEWKNFFRVTAYDWARKAEDILEIDSNETILSSSSTNKYIRIDNSWVTLSSIDEDSTPLWWENVYYSWDVKWRFILQDIPSSWEQVCQNYKANWTLKCAWKPTDSSWINPSWIHPETWEYTSYTCDWEVVNYSSCEWECNDWFFKDWWVCKPVWEAVSCFIIWNSIIWWNELLCDAWFSVSYYWETGLWSSCQINSSWKLSRFRSVACRYNDVFWTWITSPSFCWESWVKPLEEQSCNL